eukprot:849633-Pleurochrysis_carterae.AAC.1
MQFRSAIVAAAPKTNDWRKSRVAKLTENRRRDSERKAKKRLSKSEGGGVPPTVGGRGPRARAKAGRNGESTERGGAGQSGAAGLRFRSRGDHGSEPIRCGCAEQPLMIDTFQMQRFEPPIFNAADTRALLAQTRGTDEKCARARACACVRVRACAVSYTHLRAHETDSYL